MPVKPLATLSTLISDRPPGHVAIIHDGHTATYAELTQRARSIATGLVERELDRFGCVIDDPVELLSVLIASSAVGAEACVYGLALDEAAITEQAGAFDHQTIVTDRELDLDVSVLAPAELAAAVGTDEWPDRGGAAPVLILTTGTTGRPKGTRHDWRRLVAGAARWTSPSESRWLVVYNLNQFAGFQVVLHAMVSGATLVFPDHNQPRLALRALIEHRVTHVSATPTFWRHLLRLVDDVDLPDLRQITLGGESVPGDLLDELERRFPAARISQVYASTEFGSGAAVNDGANGLPISVLDRAPDADVHVRIVDGELQVRSRVGMLGYHGAPDDDTDWRPTGDLVEVRGDRIHFVGRTVEIINVGGVKVHPLIIEERVTTVPQVRFAHARGRANPVSGQIVQLDVVVDEGADEEAVEEAIRTVCEVLPAAARPRRIRFVDALDTHEHKVRRAPGDNT